MGPPCYYAIRRLGKEDRLDCSTYGRRKVLRWARENGCPWDFATRDIAAAEFGYTDYFGNLVDLDGNPIDEDDEYGYDEYPYV